MKHLLKEVWTFVLLLSSFIWFLGLPSVLVEEVTVCACQSFCATPALHFFVIIFRLWLFALRLKNLMSWSRARLLLSVLTVGYLPARVHSDVPLNLSSLLDLWQSRSKGKVRFRAGHTFCRGTETKRRKKQKGRGEKRIWQKPWRWMKLFHSSRCFSNLRLCAAGSPSTWGRRKWLHEK